MMVGVIIAVLVVAGFIGFPVWIFSAYKLEKKRIEDGVENKFTQKVIDFETMMNESPFDPIVVSDALKRLAIKWMDFKPDILSSDELYDIFDKLLIEWIPGQYVDGAQKKFFVDRLGRQVGGDYENGVARIAYLKKSTLGDTGFFHEICHAIQMEGYGKYDPDHEDEVIFRELVPMLREEFDRS